MHNLRRKPTKDALRQQASPGRSLYKSARWLALRKAILRRTPDCLRCGAPAKHIDHIRKHRGDPALFFDPRNLQPLCHSCHSRLTVRFDGGFGFPETEGKQHRGGCDEEGVPLDGGHPWNRG